MDYIRMINNYCKVAKKTGYIKRWDTALLLDRNSKRYEVKIEGFLNDR